MGIPVAMALFWHTPGDAYWEVLPREPSLNTGPWEVEWDLSSYTLTLLLYPLFGTVGLQDTCLDLTVRDL